MGVWALPNTKYNANKLKRLMSKPLSYEAAQDNLFSICGEDFLWDELSLYSRKKDVRPKIRSWLRRLILCVETEPENFAVKFSDDVINILREIVKKK